MKLTLTSSTLTDDGLAERNFTVEVEGSAGSCLGELACAFGVDGLTQLLAPHGFEPVADGTGLSLRVVEPPGPETFHLRLNS
ncbi:hypothetical protein [Deinococcus sp. SL84]|uniref:hypothetical protein n=1 Tax=Deinococcus sp. SL84 TaxID=2994663 RepID=UPI00227431D7|nr:hypothetical protein [Deinococcus sp. SL84]MCY1703570.1 hypothetical protein [Deinococcus sp. SL84]